MQKKFVAPIIIAVLIFFFLILYSYNVYFNPTCVPDLSNVCNPKKCVKLYSFEYIFGYIKGFDFKSPTCSFSSWENSVYKKEHCVLENNICKNGNIPLDLRKEEGFWNSDRQANGQRIKINIENIIVQNREPKQLYFDIYNSFQAERTFYPQFYYTDMNSTEIIQKIEIPESLDFSTYKNILLEGNETISIFSLIVAHKPGTYNATLYIWVGNTNTSEDINFSKVPPDSSDRPYNDRKGPLELHYKDTITVI